MKRVSLGRALFYTRDSGGKAETTPTQYVEWARRQSADLGTTFTGTAALIEEMIRTGQSACGDVFLDYEVCGNQLSRLGLDALIAETKRDKSVSHIFIPRRDRLARPDEPIDGMQIENSFRRDGLTLVFMDRVLGPQLRGQRADISDQIVAMIDYDSAGKFRRDLAQKILYAQLSLAKNGFSTGGRPPYGFRRWLVGGDGTQVRQLNNGEHVRMAGHHVVWLPGPEEELDVIRRIIKMLPDLPASRVARMLTEEGVPSPDSGRFRTDNGVQHRVSGVWHGTTIKNIATNPLLVAVTTYGRRSMGDQLRCSTTGPRHLTDEDFRADERPKVVRNDDAMQITAQASFEPVVDQSDHAKLQSVLESRSGSQRGVPKSKNPDKNPLGCRVFDMNCGWTMYREPYGKNFRYKCGLYQQSHGGACASNHVDGPLATKFALSCIKQWVLTPGNLGKVQDCLRQLARQHDSAKVESDELKRKSLELERVNASLSVVSRNLAYADGPDQFAAVSAELKRLTQRKEDLAHEIAALGQEQNRTGGREADAFASAELLAKGLANLAAGADSLPVAGEVIRAANAKLYLRFVPQQLKKRTVNRVAGGILTLGAANPPIQVYDGRTDRQHVKQAARKRKNTRALASQCSGDCVDSDPDSRSVGNVNRGERI
jgi:hypothetical protein